MTRALIIMLVVAAPVQAWAECAWVLWSSAPDPARGTLWAVLGANQVGGQRLCEEAADGLRDRAKQRGRQVDYLCLPDTIDPRGPKGK
jgi:hypothetical protein